jgi:hypothetical protein
MHAGLTGAVEDGNWARSRSEGGDAVDELFDEACRMCTSVLAINNGTGTHIRIDERTRRSPWFLFSITSVISSL